MIGLYSTYLLKLLDCDISFTTEFNMWLEFYPSPPFFAITTCDEFLLLKFYGLMTFLLSYDSLTSNTFTCIGASTWSSSIVWLSLGGFSLLLRYFLSVFKLLQISLISLAFCLVAISWCSLKFNDVFKVGKMLFTWLLDLLLLVFSWWVCMYLTVSSLRLLKISSRAWAFEWSASELGSPAAGKGELLFAKDLMTWWFGLN